MRGPTVCRGLQVDGALQQSLWYTDVTPLDAAGFDEDDANALIAGALHPWTANASEMAAQPLSKRTCMVGTYHRRRRAGRGDAMLRWDWTPQPARKWVEKIFDNQVVRGDVIFLSMFELMVWFRYLSESCPDRKLAVGGQ
jgi:hypothetical protein